MSLFNIDDIVKDLEQGAIQAAQEVATNLLKEAAKDASAFISMASPRLTRYISLFIARQITLEELKSLLMGLLDIAQMTALTEAGLAEIEVDKTRNAILKTVTGLVVGAVGKII